MSALRSSRARNCYSRKDKEGGTLNSPFGEAIIYTYSDRVFKAKTMSITALAAGVTAIRQVVEIPSSLVISNDFPLLKICNPNVTAEELLELSNSQLDGEARELLLMHEKLPISRAIEIVRKLESSAWDYETRADRLSSVSLEDLQSALKEVDDDDLTYSGWARDICTQAFLSKKPELLNHLETNAPNLLNLFKTLDEANLFKFFVLNNPISGNLPYDYIRSEHNGAALLTEFIRIKRDGDLDDEDMFDIADWDEDSEEEFEEFISEVREAGYGDDGVTEAELGTALHLPNIFLEDIPIEATFDVGGGSFFVSLTSEKEVQSYGAQDSPTNAQMIGIQGWPGMNPTVPVLPLFSSLGELEMILIRVTYVGEHIEDLINEYLDPHSHFTTHDAIPFYAGDIHCSGEFLLGDAGWLVSEDMFNGDSVLLTDVTPDDYGIVAFFDHSNLDTPLIVALVRGQMKRKFKILDAVHPEVASSILQKNLYYIFPSEKV